MKTRIKEIDAIRGLAILLVVLEHALGSSSNMFARVILSFHMSAFFMISGYLCKSGGGNKPFHVIALIKAKRLLVPQMTLAIITWLYNMIVGNLILHHPISEEYNLLYCFTEWWFLLVMLQVELLWDIMIRCLSTSIFRESRKDIVIAIIGGVCLVYMLFVPAGRTGMLFIAVTPVAFFFYIIGYFIHKLRLLESNVPRCFWHIICCVIFLVTASLNKPVLMYNNSYGMPLLFVLSSLTGFAVLVQIGKRLKNSALLCFCGENSLYIYVLHFKIVQGIRGILIRLMPLEDSMLGIVVFVVAGMITLGLSGLCQKYVPFLFGKSTYHQKD